MGDSQCAQLLRLCNQQWHDGEVRVLRHAQGLPQRMGKHEGAAVQRLAALYGLKCSAQGSGKRLTIMVRLPASRISDVPS